MMALINFLDTTELANLTDGWSQINVGRSDATAGYFVGGGTWNDPVTFLSSGTVSLYGGTTLAGLGNASFTFASNVSAASGGPSITTAGGNVAFNGTVTMPSTLTVNAGTGNVSFASTIDSSSARTLSVTGSTITFGGNIGSTNALGAVTLTAVNSLTMPSTVNASSVTATVTGAGNSITTSDIATGTGGSITLTSDDLTIGGNLSGTGTVTLRPNAVGRLMYIGFGSNDGTNWNLSAAEASKLVTGWSSVYIGRTDSTNYMDIGASSWTDPLTFAANISRIDGSITSTNTINFIAGTGSLTEFHTNGSITTTNKDVSFNKSLSFYNDGIISTGSGNVVIGSKIYVRSGQTASSITTTSGNITVNGNITETGGSTAGQSLTLNAGTGTISLASTVDLAANVTMNGGTIAFGGAWGGSTPLGNVTLTSVNNMTLPAITTTAGKTVLATVTGAGNKITTGAITTGAGGNITLTSDDVAIGGNLSGTGTITLQQNDTARALRINYSADDGSVYYLDTTEISKLVDGWNQINVGRADTLNALTIGTSTWTDPVNFRTSQTSGGGGTHWYRRRQHDYRNR